MVMGQGKACESVKDCYTLFCKHEHLVCLDGHCICNESPKKIELDYCKKDDDCKAICGPEWSSIKCIDGICYCKNP